MKRAGLLLLILLAAAALGACVTTEKQQPITPTDSVARSSNFVVLTAKPGDTAATLAGTYLGDQRKSWIIEEYNSTKTVQPGQEIVIPLHYDRRGGLYKDGYQLVPVLVYHRFSDTCNDPLCVKTELFEKQMRFLHENGYRSITLRDFYEFSRFQKTIPKKAVIISIDDGYSSVYDIAVPILRRYGFKATLFIYTDFVGNGKRAMDWEQLKELKNEGFDVESHTKSHADLTKKRPQETDAQYVARINKELNVPRTLFKEHLGYEPDFLAYPYGRTNAQVSDLTEKAGYLAGFTVSGKANPFFVTPYSVSRAQVYNATEINTFEQRAKTLQEQDLL